MECINGITKIAQTCRNPKVNLCAPVYMCLLIQNILHGTLVVVRVVREELEYELKVVEKVTQHLKPQY